MKMMIMPRCIHVICLWLLRTIWSFSMLYKKGVLGQEPEVSIGSSFRVVAEALLANDTKCLSVILVG